MASTRKIIRKLSIPLNRARNKFKAKKKIPPPDLSAYYLQQIANMHAQGIHDPEVIFVRLINHYIQSHLASKKANMDMADKLVGFATNLQAFPEKFRGVNYMMSVISMLNAEAQDLKEDEVIVIFGAFFSIYEIYRFHLTESAKDKFKTTDFFNDYFHREIELISREMNNDNGQRFSFIVSHKQVINCESLISFVDCILLGKIPEDMLRDLLRNTTHKDAHVRRKSAEALIVCRKKIPAELNNVVVSTIVAMIKSEFAETRCAACILLGKFYHLLPVQDQHDAMEFLLRMMSSQYEAMHSLINIANCIPQEKLRDVIHTLLREMQSKKFRRYQAFEELLQLREQISGPDREFITHSLDDYLQGKIKGFGIERIKKLSWQWLDENEKAVLIDPVLKLIESPQPEDKSYTLRKIIEFGDKWIPSNRYLFVFEHLLACLHISQLEDEAVQALNKICRLLPAHLQKPFVDYLLESIYREDTGNQIRLSRQIMALAQLSHAIPTQDRRRFVNKVNEQLKSNDPSIEYSACKASAKLVAIIPGDLYEISVDLLHSKLQWYDDVEYKSQHIYTPWAAQGAAKVLRLLANYLPKDQKREVVERLFGIACDEKAVLAGKKAAISALPPYLHCLEHDQKVAMLCRLIYLNDKLDLHKQLFSRLYNAYQCDMASHILGHVEVSPSLYVPPEIVENIVRFTKH